MAARRRKRGGGVRWGAILGGGSILVLVLAVIGVFAVWGWFKSFLHSERFQELVSQHTSAFFKSEGEFEGITWTGSSAYSDGFEARGFRDAPFAGITANGIRAQVDLGAALDGVWDVTEIQMNRLVLVTGDEGRLPGRAALSENFAELEAAREGQGMAGWLPREIHVGEVRIAEANLRSARDAQPRLAISNVEARLRPLSGSDAWSLSGKGGTLVVDEYPKLEVEVFTTRLRAGEVFVTDAAFSLLNGARLSASGEIRLGDDRELDLKLKLADLDTGELLDAAWQEKVSGTLHGEVEILRAPGEPARGEGSFKLTRGMVQGLPVLDRIADYAKAERFRRLVLHEARSDFRREGDRLELTNLVLQSDGLTRVTGDLVVENGRLIGDFRVGVTPGTLKWIPGAEQKVFVDLADGFLWTDLHLEGPVEDPSENLSARLMTAAAHQLAEDTVSSLLNGAPTGSVDETTRRAMETGRGLLDSATDSANDAVEEGKRLLESLPTLLR